MSKKMNSIEFCIRNRCRYPYKFGQRIDYLMPNLLDKRAGLVRDMRGNYIRTMNNDIVCKSLIFDVDGGFGGSSNKGVE